MTTVEERRHRSDQNHAPPRRNETIVHNTQNKYILQISINTIYAQQIIPSAVTGFCPLKLNSGQKIGCSMPTARAIPKIYIKFL